jgi:hypothetical protein
MKYNNMLVSYMTLRRMIGYLGLLLSVLLPIGILLNGSQDFIKKSISYYYWTSSQDVLVGVLCVAGALLVTYRGYDNTDRITATIAGIAAIFVALFPCYAIPGRVGFFGTSAKVAEILHGASAVVFFLALSYMSFFQFSKGNARKKIFGIYCNTIFKACGLVMVGSMLLVVLLYLILPMVIMETYAILYMLESVMLFAFGISWLVKGKTVVVI